MLPQRFTFKNGSSQNNNNNSQRPLAKLQIQSVSPPRSDAALLMTAIKTGDLKTVNELTQKKNIDLSNMKDLDGKSALDLAIEMLGTSPVSLQIATCIVNSIALSEHKNILSDKALPLIAEHIKKVKEKEALLKIVEGHVQIMVQANLSSAPKNSHEAGLNNARNISQVGLSGNKRNRTGFNADQDDDIKEAEVGNQVFKINFSAKKNAN